MISFVERTTVVLDNVPEHELQVAAKSDPLSSANGTNKKHVPAHPSCPDKFQISGSNCDWIMPAWLWLAGYPEGGWWRWLPGAMSWY